MAFIARRAGTCALVTTALGLSGTAIVYASSIIRWGSWGWEHRTPIIQGVISASNCIFDDKKKQQRDDYEAAFNCLNLHVEEFKAVNTSQRTETCKVIEEIGKDLRNHKLTKQWISSLNLKISDAWNAMDDISKKELKSSGITANELSLQNVPGSALVLDQWIDGTVDFYHASKQFQASKQQCADHLKQKKSEAERIRGENSKLRKELKGHSDVVQKMIQKHLDNLNQVSDLHQKCQTDISELKIKVATLESEADKWRKLYEESQKGWLSKLFGK